MLENQFQVSIEFFSGRHACTAVQTVVVLVVLTTITVNL